MYFLDIEFLAQPKQYRVEVLFDIESILQSTTYIYFLLLKDLYNLNCAEQIYFLTYKELRKYKQYRVNEISVPSRDPLISI